MWAFVSYELIISLFFYFYFRYFLLLTKTKVDDNTIYPLNYVFKLLNVNEASVDVKHFIVQIVYNLLLSEDDTPPISVGTTCFHDNTHTDIRGKNKWNKDTNIYSITTLCILNIVNLVWVTEQHSNSWMCARAWVNRRSCLVTSELFSIFGMQEYLC